MTVGIVMPTLNAEATIWDCLRSIVDQNYPMDKIVVYNADAGSTDFTQEAFDYWKTLGLRIVRVDNSKDKIAERGRALAIAQVDTDLTAFVDSDNVLPYPHWLLLMVSYFRDGVDMVEPLWYTRREKDGAITRYLAMMGMADPLNYWLDTYDRFNAIKQNVGAGPWTSGANGFMVRTDALKRVTGDARYQFDVDTVRSIGYDRLAKANVGIVHLVSGSWQNFYAKQRRRIRDYRYYKSIGVRPESSGLSIRRIARFCFDTITTVPLLWQAFKGNRNYRDPWAWACHVPACWLTFIAYTVGSLRKPMGPADRRGWRQFR